MRETGAGMSKETVSAENCIHRKRTQTDRHTNRETDRQRHRSREIRGHFKFAVQLPGGNAVHASHYVAESHLKP